MLASTELLIQDFERQFYNEKKISELIELLIAERNLENFIVKYKIVDKRAHFLGAYYPRVATMFINMGGIQRTYDHHLKENNIHFGTAASTRHYNIIVLDTIFHEFAHVNQTRESIKPINDSLHILIREGIKLGSKFPHRVTPYEAAIYRFFYNDILIERQAEFTSLHTILQLDDEYQFLSEREHIWLQKNLISLILRGYGKHHTPSSKYFFLRNKLGEYSRIPFNEEYTKEEILGWGMPTTPEVLSYLKQELEEREPNLRLVLK